MVFSTAHQVYLDPPNWHQLPNQQQLGGGSTENAQFPPPAPAVPPPGGPGSSGSIRPGSMAERARLAKLPQPETALKCPRCESTNTKFCYFNNYSLSQPRHFCKTCRRYWTRGGALRNVPVGGGCRRNKRSKGSRSKSPAAVLDRKAANADINMLGHSTSHQQQLNLLPPLHDHIADHYGSRNNLVLNFGPFQASLTAATGGPNDQMAFQIGNNSSSTDEWRFQQFPVFSGVESSVGIYQFEEEGNYSGEPANQSIPHKPPGTDEAAQENHRLTVSRNFLGQQQGSDQYWSANAWTDLSDITCTSSTTRLF